MKKLPSSFILLSRIIFTPLGLLLGGILGSSILENTDFLDGILANVPSPGLFNVIFIICCAVAIGVILFFIGPLVCQIIFNACGRLVHNLKKYTGQEIVAGCLGLVTGTFMASLINNLLSLVNIAWFTVTFSVLSYLFFAFVGMAIGINYLKGVIVSQDVADGRISKILDASALIDGRIAEVAKTGFVEGPFVIPAFVLSQLQTIADSDDLLKRSRGRRGLDVIKALQEHSGSAVILDDTDFPDTADADGKVLKLAKKMNGVIISVDFNLSKVAAVKKVKVLNLNELSNSVKPIALPGEKMDLMILKEGKEPGQGVSYLEDGTMVVIENGGEYIGKNAVITVTTSLQTNAGRIVFGRITE